MDRLLDKYEVCQLIGVSHISLAGMVKRGVFPQPVRLSPGPCGRRRWRASDIEAYIKRGGVVEPTRATA
jgi:predicted DNA-binding transcriptional regulator AlpA